VAGGIFAIYPSGHIFLNFFLNIEMKKTLLSAAGKLGHEEWASRNPIGAAKRFGK